MNRQATKEREREQTPNNRTTTEFRISDELWAVLHPLLPVHVNTHRGWREDAHGRRIVTVPSHFLPEASEEQPQGMCLGKGYDYQEVRDILREFGFPAHIRPRGEEATPSKGKLASKRGDGWWNGAIVDELLSSSAGAALDKQPQNYL